MCHFNHSPCGGERRAWLVGRKGLIPPHAGAPRPQPEAEQEVKLQLALQMNKADALEREGLIGGQTQPNRLIY